MAGRLAGKVAIVTGAAPQGPGIGNGSATAMLFAGEGATVILVNRSVSHAQAPQRTIEQEGGTCTVCAADVSNAADVQQLVETVVQQYGKLDILRRLFPNAGISACGPRFSLGVMFLRAPRPSRANNRMRVQCGP